MKNIYWLGYLLIISSSSAALADSMTSLKAIAAKRNFYVGSAFAEYLRTKTSINPTPSEVMAREYNMLTPENELKFQSLEPHAPVFNKSGILVPNSNPSIDFDFADAAGLMDFAQANGMKVHGHTLLYPKYEPNWLTGCPGEGAPTKNLCKTPYTSNELIQILKYHVQTVVNYYKTNYPGVIPIWDVINEVDYVPGYYDARYSAFADIIDPSTNQPSYTYFIKLAYQYAHEADPSLLLCYNESNGEDLNSGTGRYAFEFVKGLKDAGVPISCFGMEMHKSLPSDDGSTSMVSKLTLAQTMKHYADIGIKVWITEMDVGLPYLSQGETIPASPPTNATAPALYAAQAATFRDALNVCLEASNCFGFITWGFNSYYSWIGSTTSGVPEYGLPMGFSGDPLPFNALDQPKPAYTSISEALSTAMNDTTVVPASSMNASSSSLGQTLTYGTYSGSYEFWKNGALSKSVNILASGLYDFHIRAAGTLAGNDWPNLELMIDGNPVGSVSVSSAYMNDYSFPSVPLSAGFHTLSVNFTNDFYEKSPLPNRTLFVNQVWYVSSASYSHDIDAQELTKSGSGTVSIASGPLGSTNLLGNSAVSGSFTIPINGSYQIDVAGWASLLSGVGPTVTLAVDGRVASTFSVTNTKLPVAYHSMGYLYSGNHTFVVSVINDNASQKHTLFLDHVRILASVNNSIELDSLGEQTTAASVSSDMLESAGSFYSKVSFSKSATYKFTVNVASHSVKDSTGKTSFGMGQILIDGRSVGTFTADSDGWLPISLSGSVTAGTHTVAVQFINPGKTVSNFIDERNLSVQSIVISAM